MRKRRPASSQRDFGFELRHAWRDWKFKVRSYVLEHARLKPQHKALLFALYRFYGERQFSFPGRGRLARDLGYSVRQIVRLRNELVTLGLLRCEDRVRRDNGCTSKACKILFGNLVGTFAIGCPTVLEAIPRPAPLGNILRPRKCHPPRDILVAPPVTSGVTPKSLIESQAKLPPPPSPKTMTPHVALPHRDWAGVGGELRRIGLTNVAHALHVAAENSLSPQDVSALILFWERHKPAWGPGALYFRIRNGAPGVPPGEGWPPKSYAGSRSIPYAEPSTAKPLDAVSQREFLALPEHERREVLQDVLKANAFVRGLHSRNGPDSPAVIAACVARFRESKADAR